MSGRLVAAAVAAGISSGAMAWGLGRRSIGGLAWTRTNHAGDTVTLWEGAAWATGAAVGAVAGGSAPGALATLGAGAFGALDDHRGDASSKGLRGHLGALARGEVTTGAMKIIGIGATGLLSAALVDRGRGVVSRRSGATTMAGAAVIAGAANLANLLDLRPGRALKAVLVTGAPLLGGPGGASAAAAIGSALGVLVPDLRGRSMLGDTGANAAGALIGVAVTERLGLRGRATVLGALVALTLASERVSFTRVIESTPVLRELDRWGRPR